MTGGPGIHGRAQVRAPDGGRHRAPRHWRLAIVGFGSVGRALARLLADTRDELAAEHGITVAVGLLATRRGGVLVADDGAPPGAGIDLGRVLADVATDPAAPLRGARPGRAVDALRDAPVDVLVELTPLDPVDGEPATSHVRAALRSGRHVITANKGPVALHGPELRAEATAADLAFRYEPTLMDCLPVLALRDAAVPVGSIEAFAAIPNSTSNFVVDAMAAGGTLAAAVAEAQRLGIAEADPTFDLDGSDGAFKAAILAQHLLDRDVRARDVDHVGIATLDPSEPSRAREAGERIRFVARGERAGGRVCVGPERVPASSLFGSSGGFSMALALDTRHAGRLEIALIEPHTPQTAYAVLMDLLAIDLAVRAGDVRPPGPA